MNDLISRHGVSAWLDNMGHPELSNVVMDKQRFPSAQPEHLVKESGDLVKDLVKDTISRQAAIALADTLKDDVPDDERIADAVMARNEGILEYQTKLSLLPSVQPEKRTDKRTKTHACDLISRQWLMECVNTGAYVKEEDVLKFYYVESLDDYWIGRRLDHFYYATWDRELQNFVWSKSRYLPWGEHVVAPDTLWKEHTYPSEPKEIPFADWLKGFYAKYSAADVQPVVHGEWRDTGSGQECSVCGEIQYGYDTGRYYCANCGAKMDKWKGADE